MRVVAVTARIWLELLQQILHPAPRHISRVCRFRTFCNTGQTRWRLPLRHGVGVLQLAERRAIKLPMHVIDHLAAPTDREKTVFRTDQNRRITKNSLYAQQRQHADVRVDRIELESIAAQHALVCSFDRARESNDESKREIQTTLSGNTWCDDG